MTRITEAYVGAETGGASTVINVPQGAVSIVAYVDILSDQQRLRRCVRRHQHRGISRAARQSAVRHVRSSGPMARVNAASLNIHAIATENAASDILAIGGGCDRRDRGERDGQYHLGDRGLRRH